MGGRVVRARLLHISSMAACYGRREYWNSPSQRLFNTCMKKQNCGASETKLSTFDENRSRTRDRFRELIMCDEFSCRFAFVASWLRSTWRVSELQRRSISVLESVVDCVGLNLPQPPGILTVFAGLLSKRHVRWVKVVVLYLHTMTCCTVNPRMNFNCIFTLSYSCSKVTLLMNC